MKALAFLLLSAGILFGSMTAASAQQAASDATAADSGTAAETETETTAAADDSAPMVLTPEQIENLNAMVEQMQQNMDEMVKAARDTALKIGGESRTVVLTTTDLATVAVGALGGALVVDLMGGGGIATLAGAVIGGVGAHWVMTREDPIFSFDLGIDAATSTE
jgi:uncharacterized protein YcfJ